jgi:hypothetical protein
MDDGHASEAEVFEVRNYPLSYEWTMAL